MPSNFSHHKPPFHVAIIMDGNGRWATARGRARVAGHREGAKAVRRTIEAAPGVGITTLTLYAFSSDNWKRPASEVDALMRLLRRYLRTEVRKAVDNGVRLTVIGRRDRLPAGVVEAIEAAEQATAGGRTLTLRLAIDYSARHAILTAAQAIEKVDANQDEGTRAPVTAGDFSALLGAALNEKEPSSDVDLLIRTSGEQRLSDFLLWECAYAELAFSRTLWPDFGAEELARLVEDFRSRDRRFGCVNEAVGGSGTAGSPAG